MSVEAPELVSKHEWEIIHVSMIFSNVLIGNKKINSIESVNSTKRGGGLSDLNIESEVIGSDEKSVEFYISGGTKFYVYRIEVKVYSGAEQFVGDGLLEVLD